MANVLARCGRSGGLAIGLAVWLGVSTPAPTVGLGLLTAGEPPVAEHAAEQPAEGGPGRQTRESSETPGAGLAERLQQHTGVWEGEYIYFDRSGEVVDRHASRQEATLVGDRWTQRILYLWEDGRRRDQTFEARIVGERLQFEHDDLEGDFTIVSDEIAVFEATWRSTPGLRVVETIVRSAPDRQVRTWQLYDAVELRQTVRIEERRTGDVPDPDGGANSGVPSP